MIFTAWRRGPVAGNTIHKIVCAEQAKIMENDRTKTGYNAY
jgi:hypothetical protein